MRKYINLYFVSKIGDYGLFFRPIKSLAKPARPVPIGRKIARKIRCVNLLMLDNFCITAKFETLENQTNFKDPWKLYYFSCIRLQ
uniref:Uncharacterized protein n=1 Tax=Pararge aegeria TaxID=116150 RepID=S4P2E2_9NEOP